VPGTQLSARRPAGVGERKEVIDANGGVETSALIRKLMDERGSAYIIPPVDMVRDESWKQLREKVHRVNRRLAAARTGAAFLRLTEDERKAVVGRCDLQLSDEELATMLGEPSPEAARAAVLRALNRFARELDR